jgi:kynureninase
MMATDWEEASLIADAADPVASMRHHFELPTTADGKPALYVCGHSLGPLTIDARETLGREIDAWGRLGVEGHFKEVAPWFHYAEAMAEPTARLVGARPAEIVTMNSLTMNLHQLFASFYRPTRERFKIIIEDGAFPSDRYAVVSQLQNRGVDPAAGLVLASPRVGEEVLRAEDIEGLIERHRDQLALVWLPGVQYVTGQWLEMERITRAGHSAGALVGWDLAHVAGNVPVQLHDWDIDFAVWCTYKYMNAGPGATGQAFVHERWASDPGLVRLAGWWGNDPNTRFDVAFDFVPREGAASWAVSNPPVVALAPLRASLELFDEVGIDQLRERSVRLTGNLAAMLEDVPGVEVVTPSDPNARGAMLCVRVAQQSRAVQRLLGERGVILDYREPDIFRLSLAPLFNTYHEGWRFVQTLGDVISEVAA